MARNCFHIYSFQVLYLSYHQLLQMYFWRDDYAALYFAQHPDLLQKGLFAYPYQITQLLDLLAWRMFGMRTEIYFMAVIILYAFAAGLLFKFLSNLFKDSKIALFSTLIFAVGYIGQDDMKMTLDCFSAIMSLIVLLITLLFFLKYLNNHRKIYYLFTLIFFFLTLEIAPHRVAGSIIFLISLDLVISWRKWNWGLIIRCFSFISIFLVQYFIHPSSWVLGYKIPPGGNYLGLLINFFPLYLLNPLGTFWNMIFPSDFQELFYRKLGLPGSEFNLLRFYLSGLPALIVSLVSLLILKLLRPKIYNFALFGKILIMFLLLSVFLAILLFRINIYKYDLASIFNGGIFLSFLLLWIFMNMSKYKLLSIFSLVAIFGINSIFFISIPERVLVSYNRYLLLPSFVPALLPIIFVSQEYFQGTYAKRIIAKFLFIGFIAIIISLRLTASFLSQQTFVNDYSRHSKKIFQDLKIYIPEIKSKKVIFMKGANQKLDFAVGDASRVGYFGSEVAFAVHYYTNQDNIILPQTIDEIPDLLKQNPGLTPDDVFTFVYFEDGLHDTSSETRKLL